MNVFCVLTACIPFGFSSIHAVQCLGQRVVWVMDVPRSNSLTCKNKSFSPHKCETKDSLCAEQNQPAPRILHKQQTLRTSYTNDGLNHSKFHLNHATCTHTYKKHRHLHMQRMHHACIHAQIQHHIFIPKSLTTLHKLPTLRRHASISSAFAATPFPTSAWSSLRGTAVMPFKRLTDDLRSLMSRSYLQTDKEESERKKTVRRKRTGSSQLSYSWVFSEFRVLNVFSKWSHT